MEFINKSEAIGRMVSQIEPDSTAKTLENDFEKGGKPAQLGEVREWGGQKMRKTVKGWVPVKEEGTKWVDEGIGHGTKDTEILSKINEKASIRDVRGALFYVTDDKKPITVLDKDGTYQTTVKDLRSKLYDIEPQDQAAGIKSIKFNEQKSREQVTDTPTRKETSGLSSKEKEVIPISDKDILNPYSRLSDKEKNTLSTLLNKTFGKSSDIKDAKYFNSGYKGISFKYKGQTYFLVYSGGVVGLEDQTLGYISLQREGYPAKKIEVASNDRRRFGDTDIRESQIDSIVSKLRKEFKID